jgi:hypothetical protein
MVETKLKQDVLSYVASVMRLPIQDYEQLVSMIILHFDIPDETAKQLTWEAMVRHFAIFN